MKGKIKVFTKFRLCKESDGYLVYYDYQENKLYRCYMTEEESRPNYAILLVQPFLVFGLEAFGKWISRLESWSIRITWILALVLSTIIVQVFCKNWIKCTEETVNKRFRELTEPTQEEWKKYLDLGRLQLKKKVQLYIWMGLGIVGSAVLFLWSGVIVLLYIYFAMYLIFYLLVVEEKPIRKYNFIKSRRKRR